MFLEEDEAKTVENPTNSYRVLLGPKHVKIRATLDIPPAPPLAVPSPDVFPPPVGQTIPFSWPERLLTMLHSLHHGQYLLV